jgi:hypothetical protein
MDPDDLDATETVALTALAAMIERDTDMAGRAVAALAVKCGRYGLGYAMQTWIDHYLQHISDGQWDGDPAFFGAVRFYDVDTGQILDPETVGLESPEDLWVGRLIFARATNDEPTFTHYATSLPQDDVIRHVLHLLHACAAVIRNTPPGGGYAGAAVTITHQRAASE